MKYVDLFAGCGGLSLGIEKAGGQLVLAVEKSDMAARTYYHNFIANASSMMEWNRHLNSTLEDQVNRKVLVRELDALLREDRIMGQLANASLDLVAGGPPCQGFSLAGRRNPDDARNKLAWEYLRFVEQTCPKAVVIENVVGMNHKFAKQDASSFAQLKTALAELGPQYVVQGVWVNAMHYGAPQHRPRLMIIAVRSDVAARNNIQSEDVLWRSNFLDKLDGTIPDLAPIPTLHTDEGRTVGDAIADLRSDKYPPSPGNTAYLRELDNELPRHHSSTTVNHVPRRHNEKTVRRFRLYQYLSSNGLDQRILSKSASMSDSDAINYIRQCLQNAPIPSTSPDGTVLAKSLDELCNLALTLTTRKHSQKVLEWSKPARTVVTLPDDYVHPMEPRIFTVRELARFQGFPSHFEFMGKETTGANRRRTEVPQYSQVGNAVSPWLSLAVGRRLKTILDADNFVGEFASDGSTVSIGV